MKPWIKANKSYTTELAIVLFGAGVLLRSFFDWGLALAAFLVLISLALIFLFSFFRQKKLYLASLLMTFLSFGYVWASIRLPVMASVDMPHGVYEGVVASQPKESESSINFLVDVVSEAGSLKFLVITERYRSFKVGHTVRMEGRPKLPENFRTATGREFDYKSFLLKDGVSHILFFPDIEVTGHGSGLSSGLFSLKDRFLEEIASTYPEPHSSYLAGLLLGKKDSLGKELEEDFRRVGLSHVVVLSGYNVSIIADSLIKASSVLPKLAGPLTAIPAIIIFAVVVGGGAAIVRASIMAVIVILAKWSGRRYDIERSLFVAGFLMLLENPAILPDDPSFQLSFLASFSLIYIAPKIQKLIPRLFGSASLAEIAAGTLSAQIMVFPLLLKMTGEVSVVSPIVNLIVLPLIPATMLLGFVSVLAGLLTPLLGFLISPLAYILLYFQIEVVEIFSSLDFSSIRVGNYGAAEMILSYLVLIASLKILFSKMDSRRSAGSRGRLPAMKKLS